MYQKFHFKNGLKLILAPLKETKAVTVLILLPVGSRYETPSISGISHFIEHLIFKGTKKRPKSLDITRELDAVGADYNAFTAKDHTGFYVKVAAERIELAFDILADVLFNSLFDPLAIEKERGVILEEINMYEDNPLLYISHLFEATVFGNYPLGWQIYGSRETIKKIFRKDILEYKNRHYQSNNFLITIAGNFNQKIVKNLIEKYFGLNGLKTKKIKPRPIKIQQAVPKIDLYFKETEQIHLALGFPAYSFFHQDIYTLTILAVILGGNMSSRLFVKIREEQGLAYYLKAEASAFCDTGTLMIQAGLDKSRVFLALKLILKELDKIKKEEITLKELQAAQEFLKGKIILALEDSEMVADWYGKQELLQKRILIPEEKIKKIFAVTQKDLQKVANDIIKSQKLNLALIGPFKEKKEFLKLLRV